MDIFRFKRTGAHQPLGDDDERAAKRISTPAGQRLSLILESTEARRSKSPAANTCKNAKINVTTTSTYCNDPTHQHIGHVHPAHKTPKRESHRPSIVSVLTCGKLGTPRESVEARTPNGSNLSFSVWSDRDAEKFGQIRHQKHGGSSRWTRKKMAIVVAILLAVIIALAVGLAVGMKRKSSQSESPSSTLGSTQPVGNQASPTSGSSESNKPATSVSAMPSGFPLGTYSLVAFLDTVQSACTANNETWSCPPSTDYYSDPQKALTVMNWQISGSPGSYVISSNGQDATLGTMFQNEKLVLLDAGKDTERYRFQISRAKSVNMTGSIGDSRGDFTCDYVATNIQANLYTKMARTYPKDTIAVPNSGNPAWPFAVRVEQTVAGGENVPSCKKRSGEKIGGLASQDAGTLCSCLYRNWSPAKIGS